MRKLEAKQICEDLDSLKSAAGTGENPSPIALDLETTGLRLHFDRVDMLSWATNDKCGVVTLRHFKRSGYVKEAVLPVVQKILSNPRQLVIFHNAKFDLGMMITRNWIRLDQIKARIFDTQQAQHLLGPVDRKEGFDYKLKGLAVRILELDEDQIVEFEELTKRQKFPDVPFEDAKSYAGNDTYFTYQLYEELNGQLQARPTLLHYFNEIEMPHVLNTVEMETNGLGLGPTPFETLVSKIAECIERAIEPRTHLTNLRNVRSRNQMRQFLNQIEAPIGAAERDRFTQKLKLNTGSFLKMLVRADTDLARKGLVHVIRLRGLVKAQQKYDEFRKYLNSHTGRLHPGYFCGLSTGRYAASRPNVLELSSKSGVRDVIQAAVGNVLVVADFSQIDLRVIADLAASAKGGTGELLQRVNGGYDLHLNTLRLVRPDLNIDKSWKKIPDEEKYKNLGQLRKTLAKPINFGIAYGLGASGLAENLNNLDELERNLLETDDVEAFLKSHLPKDTIEYAKRDGEIFLERFHQAYPEIQAFQSEAEKQLLERGFAVNPFGRECVPPLARLLMTGNDLELDLRFDNDTWLRVKPEGITLDENGLTMLLKEAWLLAVHNPKKVPDSQVKPTDLKRAPAFRVLEIDVAEAKKILGQSKHLTRYTLAGGLIKVWNEGVRDSLADLFTPGYIGENDIESLPWVFLPHRVIKVVRIGGGEDAPELKYQKYDWMRRRTISYLVQSTSMDFSKIAMTEFRKAVENMDPRPFLVNCIHDEIVVECREDQAEDVKGILLHCMQNNERFRELAKSRPLKVDIVAEAGSDRIYGKAKK